MLTQTTQAPHRLVAHGALNPGPAERLARRVVLAALRRLRWGRVDLIEGDQRTSFGDMRPNVKRVTLTVHRARFYARLFAGGTVGAGEAFADGDWSVCDLTLLVRLMAANRLVLEGLDSAPARAVKGILETAAHRLRANTRGGSAANIAAHYDLSNEFFKTFLDARMMYSSALYPHPCADLEQASENKLQRICDLLDLRSGQRVLEIGGGWGGLAIFVASRYDVHVTTTTISKAQFEEAQARVALAGLEDRVDVRLEDYRDVQGVYDRVVSIEMVEAVGDEFLDGYFRQVENLLLPGGRFVMQAITIQDQRYAAALREVDFIKKHIFPGSFIPSVSRLVNAAGRTRTMKLIALDDIGEHYARTLAAWSQRFAAARDQLDALGFDGRFQRLWRFYFSYCEGGFLEQAISDVQMVFGTAPHPLSVELC